MRARDISILLLSVLGVGCDPFGTDHSFRNEGRLCLFPAGSADANHFVRSTMPLEYRENQALDLTVMIPRCLSGSCSHDEKAECTATLTGNVVDVQSAASYRQQGATCTDDCRLLAARCSTPPLPPGSYEFRHGATNLAITIPSTVVPPCVGMGLGGP